MYYSSSNNRMANRWIQLFLKKQMNTIESQLNHSHRTKHECSTNAESGPFTGKIIGIKTKLQAKQTLTLEGHQWLTIYKWCSINRTTEVAYCLEKCYWRRWYVFSYYYLQGNMQQHTNRCKHGIAWSFEQYRYLKGAERKINSTGQSTEMEGRATQGRPELEYAVKP
jgi:hypothetical protein